jgi:hypothetical protein
MEAQVARAMPPLQGAAGRLADWLSQPCFAGTRSAVGRRVLRELMGPRRLRPSSPREEIELLRALGMALTASSGQLMPLEGVQEAFSARSRSLVTAEFVEALLGRDGTARQEAEQLIWLCENVIGPANKRQAARYLASHIGSLRFETEVRAGVEPPTVRLAMLASLQKGVGRAGLDNCDVVAIQGKIGEVGGLLEADVKLVATLLQAHAPVMHRLNLLVRLSMGEAAPTGPATERARAGALKLLRSDSARSELSSTPGQLAQVRDLLQSAGIAA